MRADIYRRQVNSQKGVDKQSHKLPSSVFYRQAECQVNKQPALPVCCGVVAGEIQAEAATQKRSY